jgi:hypothetical protein
MTLVRWLLPFALFGLSGCDPEGKEKCQWTLEPEERLIGKTEPNLIPVCARNRTTNKEDCRFQTTLEFAKSAWTKHFRYVDIDADLRKAPKVIRDIKYCDPSKER